jgi:hypothetical protein
MNTNKVESMKIPDDKLHITDEDVKNIINSVLKLFCISNIEKVKIKRK